MVTLLIIDCYIIEHEYPRLCIAIFLMSYYYFHHISLHIDPNCGYNVDQCRYDTLLWQTGLFILHTYFPVRSLRSKIVLYEILITLLGQLSDIWSMLYKKLGIQYSLWSVLKYQLTCTLNTIATLRQTRWSPRMMLARLWVYHIKMHPIGVNFIIFHRFASSDFKA